MIDGFASQKKYSVDMSSTVEALTIVVHKKVFRVDYYQFRVIISYHVGHAMDFDELTNEQTWLNVIATAYVYVMEFTMFSLDSHWEVHFCINPETD